MVLVKQVNLSMFPQFYPLLKEINPQLTEAEWYSVFAHRWYPEEKFCGYGLFDDTKIVGFLGLIFSQRIINGQLENFCNLTSWIVKESYRGRGISLMLSLRKLMKDYTITDLSASDNTIAIAKRLGFQELDTRMVVLPSVFGGINHHPQLKIITEKSLIQSQLQPLEQRLLEDHSSQPRCHHLLIKADGEHCYLIFTLVKNAKFPYSYIQYLGNPKLFDRFSLPIRQAIAKINQTFWVLVDHRMLKGVKPTLSFDLPIEACKLYKSSKIKPEEIDNLYSELVILDFNPIPGFTWRELINNFKKYNTLAKK
jgi:hypothetical protein